MIWHGVSGPRVATDSLLAPELLVQLVDLKKRPGNVRKVILIALHRIQQDKVIPQNVYARKTLPNLSDISTKYVIYHHNLYGFDINLYQYNQMYR